MFNSYVSHYQGLWIPLIFHTFSLGIFQDSLVAWHLWTVACLPGRAGAHATAAVVRVKRGEPAQRWGFLRKTRYLPSGNLTIFNIAIENGYL